MCFIQGYDIGQVCVEIETSHDRLRKWRAHYPGFAEAWDRIKDGEGEEVLDDFLGATGQTDIPAHGILPEVPDLRTFRREAFGLDTPPHLAEIAHHILDCDCRKVLILVPPSHAKTTLARDIQAMMFCQEAEQVSRLGPGERLENPKRMAVFSETSSMAETMGWQLRQTMLDSDMYPYVAQWGPFKKTSVKWSAKGVYMPWRSAEEKDPSIQWLGWKNQIQGARLTHAFLDDVDSPGTARSERQLLLKKLDHTIIRRLDENGKLIIMGTRVDEDDFYSMVLRRVDEGFWHAVILPAVDEEGKVTWDRYTPDYFDAVRAEMGNDALFNLVYQQVSVPDGTGLFDWDLLEGCKRPHLDLQSRYPDGFTVAAIDPALEGPWAAAAWQYSPEQDTMRLLDILDGTGGGYDAMDRAVSWCLAHSPNVLGIEKTGGMSLFVSPDIKQRIAQRHCRLELIETGSQGMNDAHYGFSALSVWMRQGKVELPWSEAARRFVAPFLDEAARFRLNPPSYDGDRPKPYTGRKDRLMASWFCFRLVLTFGRQKRNIEQFGAARQRAPWIASQQRVRYIDPRGQ